MKLRTGVAGALGLLLAAGLATQVFGPGNDPVRPRNYRCAQDNLHTVTFNVVLDEPHDVDVSYSIGVDSYLHEMRDGSRKFHDVADDVACGTVVELSAIQWEPGVVRCAITVGGGDLSYKRATETDTCHVRVTVA